MDAPMATEGLNFELPEEDVRHGVVVVLTGVHEQVAMPASQHLAPQCGGLHELRPRPDDVNQGEFSRHESFRAAVRSASPCDRVNSQFCRTTPRSL